MKQGTIELAFLGISFFALQVWWISMTIKKGRNEEVLPSKLDQLAATKKRLENLLKK